MCGHIANDKKYGRSVFRYHPRSDEHSKRICSLVIDHLLMSSPLIRAHAEAGIVVGGINCTYTFTNGKRKTLDLAIGTPVNACGPSLVPGSLIKGEIRQIRIACEAKQCMTEHSKSKPRIFDELSSSHEIVHRGEPNAIAAGIVVVNLASSYASPTRQERREGELIITAHRQPDVTADMVKHLQGLAMRDAVGEVGFDAFATIVINCDNTGPCTLHTDPPAPQPGDPHHYESFLKRITSAYAERFA